MRRSARCGMMTAALLFAVSSHARADDKATREAEARFTEGLARVKTRDYEAARLSFAQAYAVLHRPLILWNLALAEEKATHPLDALAHFREFASESPTDTDRANAQKHVDALLAQLGRIDVQAPPGTSLVLDGGNFTGSAPLPAPFDVMPGHHVVEAKFPSGGGKTSDVDAVAGQVAHVAFAPDAPPAAAVAAAVGSAPAAPASSTPATAPTDAQPSEPPPDTTQAHKSFWTARTTTAAVLVAGGAVAAGFGLYFGLASQHNNHVALNYKNMSTSTSTCVPPGAAPYCGTWNDAVNAQNRDAAISNALYFVGGAFVVGAAVSWFFWPKPKNVVSAWVAPAVGEGNMGIEAGGRF
jgi:hypothetical protein